MRNLFGAIKGLLGWVWFIVLWAAPPFLAFVGSLLPSLNYTVGVGEPLPDVAFVGMVIIGVPLLIWLGMEAFSAANRETPSRMLMLDLAVAILWFGVFSTVGGYLYGSESLKLWFLIPWIFTGLDALFNGVLAINNAVQKPVFNQAPGG